MEQARTPLTGHSAGHWLGVGGDSRWRRRVSIGWGLARGPAQGVSPSGQCGWPAASGHFVSSWRPSGAGWLRWKSRRDVQLARATTGSRLRATGWTRFRFLSLSHHHRHRRRRRGTPTNPISCVLRATPARSWRVCVYATHVTWWATSPLSLPPSPLLRPQPPGLILIYMCLLLTSFK